MAQHHPHNMSSTNPTRTPVPSFCSLLLALLMTLSLVVLVVDAASPTAWNLPPPRQSLTESRTHISKSRPLVALVHNHNHPIETNNNNNNDTEEEETDDAAVEYAVARHGSWWDRAQDQRAEYSFQKHESAAEEEEWRHVCARTSTTTGGRCGPRSDPHTRRIMCRPSTCTTVVV